MLAIIWSSSPAFARRMAQFKRGLLGEGRGWTRSIQD
jgi:hypothetical protein